MAAVAPARLTVDIEPRLRRSIRLAAARREVSIKEFVVTALEEALRREPMSVPEDDWFRASIPSLERDWNSDEDAVYDQLPER